MTSWKVILAALVIFAAGVVTGGLTVNLGSKISNAERPQGRSPLPFAPDRVEQQHRELIRRMDRHLNLTPDQRDRVTTILRDGQRRIRQAWDQVAPQAQGEFRQIRSELRAVLNPEQQKRFEEIFKARPLSPEERAFREETRRGGGQNGPRPQPENEMRRRPGFNQPGSTQNQQHWQDPGIDKPDPLRSPRPPSGQFQASPSPTPESPRPQRE